jgi:hypothetical protein
MLTPSFQSKCLIFYGVAGTYKDNNNALWNLGCPTNTVLFQFVLSESVADGRHHQDRTDRINKKYEHSVESSSLEVPE